jgi:diguanylate cyclase (GGDEF)-like protein
MRRKLKLTTLFVALVAASMISTILVLLVASYESEKITLRNTTLALNGSKAGNISSSIDSLFHTMSISLKHSASYLEAEQDKLSDAELQKQLELLLATGRYFNSITWVDETGHVRNIAPAQVGLKGKVITNEETRKALEARKPYLSAPHIAPTGRMIVFMSYPLFDSQGSYKGIIGGSIYLRESNVLSEYLGHNAIAIEENGSYFYVVGPHGKLLFHPDADRIGDSVTANPVVHKLMNGESGEELVTNTRGVSMLAAYRFAPVTGWGVIQQTPVASIDQLLIHHIGDLFLSSMFPFLILLVLSVLVARRLAAPFMSLAKLMKQLSAGNPIPVPPTQTHWNQEADLLTKSVMLAMETVQHHTKQLQQDASTDVLTGLGNRRALEDWMNTWSEKDEVVSLIIMDVDDFKEVNDTFGHQAGDDILRHLATVITSHMTIADRAFRYGGEEFVVVSLGSSADDAHRTAEEIRRTMASTISPIGKPITISLGIAACPRHASEPKELFQLADQALYQSKQQGKNRTTMAQGRK